MAKSTLLHPQFFHTLAPGFHTHLTIPLDFFSKYIEARIPENTTTAELKSDSSDITWNVKMTGRRLSEGWREFAVDNNLQLGNVVVFRYEGETVFRVSDLGSSCCEVEDIPLPPRNSIYSQDEISKTLLKKRLYPRTQVDGYDEEFQRKKKVRKNNVEAEAVSTSLSDKSCFVALVTASSLRTDKMYLPQHVTSSNGLSRRCRKIVLINGGERSWTLDLSFNKSSDAFYMSRGWRNFCDENGQEAGGFFMFKLANGDTPVLSFSRTDSRDDRNQRDCSEASERESLSTESPVLSFCSTESVDIERQRDCSETSESESLSTELTSEEENTEGESSEDDCSSEESLMEIGKKKCSQKRRAMSYSSYSPCHKQFVTFTLPHDYVTLSKLSLPKPFVRANGINKPGEIFLLGKDGKKWPTRILLHKRGNMNLGKGWKEFVKANGLQSGFTLKLIWEDTTPVLSLCHSERSIDIGGGGGGCSETNQETSLPIEPNSSGKISKDKNINDDNGKEKNTREENGKYSTPSSQKQFVKLTITPSCFRKCFLTLPAQFARENSMKKPGMMIYLLGKGGRKWLTEIKQHQNKTGLGKGWKDFAKANNFKSGDSFRMELIWKDGTRMLRLCHKESSSSKANKKESVFTESGSRDSSSAVQNRFVTLTLTPEDARACMLILPSQFMKDNGINKLGKITILGENKMECSAYLLTRGGIVALEDGWDEFCEANGVNLGESFTLEFINEQDRTTPVLKFCSRETN